MADSKDENTVEHFVREVEGKVGTILTTADARAAHHLASADPELDGLLTGPAHEAKYLLERAEASAENWRAHGVHPKENRALRPGERGFENLRGSENETTDATGADQTTTPAKSEDTSESSPRSRA